MFDASKFEKMTEGQTYGSDSPRRVRIVSTSKVVLWLDSFDGSTVPLDVLEGAGEYRLPSLHFVRYEGEGDVYLGTEQPVQWVQNNDDKVIYTSVDMRPKVPDAVTQIQRQVKMAEIAASQRMAKIEAETKAQMARWNKRMSEMHKAAKPAPDAQAEPKKIEGEE